MAAVGKLAVRVVFADDTKQTITIDRINPTVGPNRNIKNLVMSFNQESGGTLAPKMKSANGFNWIGIDSVVYTVTDRNYIF